MLLSCCSAARLAFSASQEQWQDHVHVSADLFCIPRFPPQCLVLATAGNAVQTKRARCLSMQWPYPFFKVWFGFWWVYFFFVLPPNPSIILCTEYTLFTSPCINDWYEPWSIGIWEFPCRGKEDRKRKASGKSGNSNLYSHSRQSLKH